MCTSAAFGADDALSRDAIERVGVQAARWSLANQMDNMSYQNMCAAYGILKIAAATSDEQLRRGVEEAFRPELLEGRNPHRDNARNRPPHQWFGFVPLELYRQTRNPDYLKRGIELAEKQYHNADENGMPAYTARGYVDQQWRLREVCVGTGVGRNRQHYLDRPRRTGDAHGQAPLLWAAASLLEANQP